MNRRAFSRSGGLRQVRVARKRTEKEGFVEDKNEQITNTPSHAIIALSFSSGSKTNQAFATPGVAGCLGA